MTVLAETEGSSWPWIRRGMLGMFSPPALILTTAHIGFAGLARDAGISWPEATFMVFTIWALPANIILVGAITSGLSLAATAFAVGLSSLRLMPMVVSLMPELKGPGTRRWPTLVLSHFIAITAWVFAMQSLRDVPREHRLAYFGGFGATLCTVNTLVVAVAFNLMGQLPALATGALAFLTPVYFLTSLYGSARDISGKLGLLTGMLALPIGHAIDPELDILLAGIGGGLIAYFVGEMARKRGEAKTAADLGEGP